MDPTEEYRGDADDEDWYQSDLRLAAELGKALLERNRDLEIQVLQLQQANQEQSLENEFLAKQVEIMRETTESRARVYEDLDKSNQDLERANQRLLMEAKADKQRMDKLVDTINSLEDKVEELQKKVEDMKSERSRQRKQQKQESRRAVSLASLKDRDKHDYLQNVINGDVQWTYTDNFKNLPLNPYELEIKNLQESVKQMKAQLLIEKRRKGDLETEVNGLLEENEGLNGRLKAEAEARQELVSKLEDELHKVKVEAGSYCVLCGLAFKSSDKTQRVLEKDVEHDNPELHTAGKLVRLGGGGSVYGSRESVNKIAPDSKELSPDEPDNILSELESQYQSLFKKYETLIENGGDKRSSFHEATGESFDEALHKHLAVSHKEVQTLIKIHKCSDAATGMTSPDSENPPPYKTLFRELFATLKKTRIDESNDNSDRSREEKGASSNRSSPTDNISRGMTSSKTM